MLTEVVRNALAKVPNRFQLVVLTAERCRQLLEGARPAVENPNRERWMKLAAREVADGRVVRDGDTWKVERPAGMEVFPQPSLTALDDEIFRFRDEEE